MLKKTIAYTDYNGTTRKEDFYFNLTQAEVTELEVSVEGGPGRNDQPHRFRAEWQGHH